MHRPDNIVAHMNATRILRFVQAGNLLSQSPASALNLYCPFIPDEILVHTPHGAATNGNQITGIVNCDLFRFQDDGFIGCSGLSMKRDAMRFILPRGTFPPVKGNYDVRWSSMTGGQITSTVDGVLTLTFEFIRYGTPGQPRD